MSQYLSEAFKRLDALNEDTFKINENGLEDFVKFEEEDELDATIDIIDPEAETEEELEDSYVGKVILDCTVCHSKIYKDKADVIIKGDLANIDEECPFCYTTDGYKVIGQVSAFEEESEEDSEDEEEEEAKTSEESDNELEEGLFDFGKKKREKEAKAKAEREAKRKAEQERREKEEADRAAFAADSWARHDRAEKQAKADYNRTRYNGIKGDKPSNTGYRGVSYSGGDYYSESYKDTHMMMGGDGSETYSDEDLRKIWDENHTSDPSMKEYTSFDAWKKDTVSNMEKLDEATAVKFDKPSVGTILAGHMDELTEFVSSQDTKAFRDRVLEIVENSEADPKEVEAFKGRILRAKNNFIILGTIGAYMSKMSGDPTKRSDEALNEAKKDLVQFSYCVYSLDDDGEELDCEEEFNNEKEAIEFAKSLEAAHVVFVPTPDSDEGPEYAEYIEANAPYDDYAIVWASDANESLNEDVNNVNVETDDSIVNVATDEAGKVTVTTEPKETVPSEEEFVAPIEPEVKNELEDNKGENEEIEIDLDEFDEGSFNELGEGYLKKVYDNVESFKTSNVSMTSDKLMVEGVIKFASGKSKKTNFIFESKTATKTGKVKFIGENREISKGRKSFCITGKIDNKKFLSESFNYNYSVKDSEGKSLKLYGTVRKGK